MNTFISLFIVTASLMGIAFLLMAIRTIVVRNGKFPNTSISANKELRKLGITCAKCEEQAKFNRMRKNKKINPEELIFIPVKQ